MGEEQPKNPWAEPAGEVLTALRRGDSNAAYALIEHYATELPTNGPVPGFNETALALYWQHRALPEHIAVAHERLRRLEAALAVAAKDEHGALIRALGGTNYNLASFAWPGWGEPDIQPSPADLAAGRAAAAACLAIRTDPANQDVAFGFDIAMAHWVAGAWRLAEGAFDAARQHFEISREDRLAKGEDDAIYTGYLALTDVLEHPGDEAAESHYATALGVFKERQGDSDARFFYDQLVAARRALSS